MKFNVSVVPSLLLIFTNLFLPSKTWADFDCSDRQMYLQQITDGAPDCNGNLVPDVCDLQQGGQGFGTITDMLADDEYFAFESSFHAADVDNDTDVDILGHKGSEVVLLKNMAGTLQPPVTFDAGTEISTIAVLDLGGDDAVDIVVAPAVGNSLLVFGNDGNGSFLPGAFVSGGSAGMLFGGDFNGDGRDDLLQITSTSNSTITRFIQSTDGILNPELPIVTDVTSITGAFPADINGDGISDIIIYSKTSYQVFLGGAVLTPLDMGLFPEDLKPETNIAVVDVDGDGFLDLLYSHQNTTRLQADIIVAPGNGSGDFSFEKSLMLRRSFTQVATGNQFNPPFGGSLTLAPDMYFADFDNDGDVDVALRSVRLSNTGGPGGTTHIQENLVLFVNNGDGYFGEVHRVRFGNSGGYLVATSWAGYVFADLDGSGLPDVVGSFAGGITGKPNTSRVSVLWNKLQPFSPDENTNGIPDECSAKLLSPAYLPWNSYLDMINILEVTNLGTTREELTLRIGHEQITFSLAAGEQRDIILNGFSFFQPDQYGMVQLDFSGDIRAQTVFYRTHASSVNRNVFGDYEFAFPIPATNPLRGVSHLPFNTFSPSRNPVEMSGLVAQWITLINLDFSDSIDFIAPKKGFLVSTYAEDGRLLARNTYFLQPGERLDVDGGHGIAGSNKVGFHEIEALDPHARYLAYITRYGSSGGGERFTFAVPVTGSLRQGMKRELYVADNNMTENWLEFTNVSDRKISATIEFDITSGATSYPIPLTFDLQPRQTYHLPVKNFMSNRAASVSVYPHQASDGLLVQSMFYTRDFASGSLQSVYVAVPSKAVSPIVRTSYNLFLGMYNWLRIANSSDTASLYTVRIYPLSGRDAGPLFEGYYQLEPRHLIELPLHETQTYGTSINTYGLIEVQSQNTGKPSVELVRIKPTKSNSFDFIVQIPGL